MSSVKVDEKCPFCLIVKDTIPSHKVHETEHTLAFLDIFPISEGHTQVIPKCQDLTSKHVDHVHFHVIPKPNEKEGLLLSEEVWKQKKPEKEELAATAEKMKAKI
ncbi:hypothetical protein EWM64_g667 [Hericium alpestre]|uniref:HIT domain-containing protein n=1 Tax=Hericium alpestre TaxID=135208 RepID=A0A4Z0A8E1_9AGAM|nr:hypothetical protein EWM64_g667 [Hericium alpestre]